MTAQPRAPSRTSAGVGWAPFRSRTITLAILALAVVACADAQVPAAAQDVVRGDAGRGNVPVVGLPCEGCEAVFVGMPDAIPATSRLAPEDEPGEPMVLRGTVYDAASEPAPGVVIYAYQTDATGVYPPDEAHTGWARRHGRLRGWARTDAGGRYRFETIRPASYPGQRIPAHVHMHVVEPDRCTYYIDSVHFTDDPLLRRDPGDDPDPRGGSGIVEPRREDGTWVVERDVFLGRNVPGYRECASLTQG